MTPRLPTAVPQRATSGAYPLREPATIEDVERMLNEHGFVTFRCDEGIIVDVPAGESDD